MGSFLSVTGSGCIIVHELQGEIVRLLEPIHNCEIAVLLSYCR